MKTIVVGYDDSQPAKRALARAAEIAGRFGARIVVTSVAPVLVSGHGVGPTDPLDPPEEHRRVLMDAAAFLIEHGVEGEFDLALDDPAAHILHLAKQREADLVVVGTHEPGFVQRLLGLSVSDKVERKAHCDVMVVH